MSFINTLPRADDFSTFSLLWGSQCLGTDGDGAGGGIGGGKQQKT